MRKLLVALMIVAFAATAFADVKLSGYYNVNGIYKQNLSAVDDNDDDKNSFYEQEFKIWIKADTDKDTFFKSKLQVSDNTWAEDGHSGNDTGYQKATNLQVERAWMGHNFGAVKLEVGLMDGGAWSYAFNNNKEGYYRVKATIPAGPGNIVAFTQKVYENNEEGVSTKDAEKDDADNYFIAYSGKVGGISFAPSINYAVDSSKDFDGDMGGSDSTTTKFDIGVGGNFGAVGFESEFIYQTKDIEVGEDAKVWGAYANVFGKVAGAKVGFFTAYSAYDEDTNTALDMGDDFDDDIAVVLGEEGYFGSQDLSGSYSGIGAAWLNAVYASFDVNDKLNINGAFVYAMSTIDKSTSAYDDATAYEIDLGLDYAITKALSYNVDFGYAKADLDSGTDPKAGILLQHGLTLSF